MQRVLSLKTKEKVNHAKTINMRKVEDDKPKNWQRSKNQPWLRTTNLGIKWETENERGKKKKGQARSQKETKGHLKGQNKEWPTGTKDKKKITKKICNLGVK